MISWKLTAVRLIQSSKPKDLFASLVSGQKFSKLDLSQVYQQICLVED